MLLKKYILTENYKYKRFKCKTSKGSWRSIVCGDCIHFRKNYDMCDTFNEDHRGFCGMSIAQIIFTESEFSKLKQKGREKRLTHFYSLQDSR